MNCLRCGAEVAEGESFCANCLAEMEKYPVPPDTYVMIPKRSAQRPSVRKTTLSDDEKLRIFNSQLKRARIWIAILLIVIAGLSAFGFCCGISSPLLDRTIPPSPPLPPLPDPCPLESNVSRETLLSGKCGIGRCFT